jgi:hypothetical protein
MISRISPSSSVIRPDTLQSRGTVFRHKLEKHIRDHKSGEGHLSREMYGEVKKSKRENSELLKGTEASALYASYSTLFLRYEKAARMNTHLNEALRQTQKITEASDIREDTLTIHDGQVQDS